MSKELSPNKSCDQQSYYESPIGKPEGSKLITAALRELGFGTSISLSVSQVILIERFSIRFRPL